MCVVVVVGIVVPCSRLFCAILLEKLYYPDDIDLRQKQTSAIKIYCSFVVRYSLAFYGSQRQNGNRKSKSIGSVVMAIYSNKVTFFV